MTRKQKRLAVIGGGMSFIIVAVLLVMFAFSQSVAYFYMPADLAKAPVPPETRIRLGGLVGEGSVVRGAFAVGAGRRPSPADRQLILTATAVLGDKQKATDALKDGLKQFPASGELVALANEIGLAVEGVQQ